MPCIVSYRIIHRDDGRFDLLATMEPGRNYRREGFATLAEIDESIEGLRVLMTAVGAPVAHADAVVKREPTPDTTKLKSKPSKLGAEKLTPEELRRWL